jgi:tetratricopeptide (TPR) repeat protein
MSSDPNTLFEFSRKIHQAGHLDSAVLGYADLLKATPDYPHARYLYACALVGLNHPDKALPEIQAHLKKERNHAPGWVTLGDCYSQQEMFSEAAATYQEAIRLEPKNLDAAKGLGNLLVDQSKWTELNKFADSLLKVHPGEIAVLGFKSSACKLLEDHKAGLIACAEFMARNGHSEKCHEWAEEFFTPLIHPDDAVLEAIKSVDHIRGKVLYYRANLRAGRLKIALEVLQEIREADPDYQHLQLEFIADSLQYNKFYGAAEPYRWELVEKYPDNDKLLIKLIENTLDHAKRDFPEKYSDARELGKILMERSDETIESFGLMASIYMHASRPEMALPYYDHIIEQQPDHPLASPYLFTLNYDERRPPEQVFQAHVNWGERFASNFQASGNFEPLDKNPLRPLRIGYISPDLGQHPVGFFAIDIFKEHNPEQVEVFLYSNRLQGIGDDKLSQQFRAQVGEDHWRWTRGFSTAKVVRMIRDDKIDVLVDMAGHTGYNRLDVLASRAAPIQVSWLGYANTTGLKEVDYRLSDAIVEPEGDADARSVEKIYRMPNGFHMFNLHPQLPKPSAPPCLERCHITFGSYNNMNKLGSKSIELWSKLLKRVPNSKILLKHKTLAVLDNRESLRSLFAMHGIQAHRVILRTTTPGLVEHYKSYGEMDIALDPLAYNGTTTSCDALAMGLPILTLPGRTHASRVTASLLHRVGLDDWIAQSEEDFLTIGALAAQNPGMLKALRKELPGRFRCSPLGDGPGMARDLEQAYRHMWREFCSISSKNQTELINMQPLRA